MRSMHFALPTFAKLQRTLAGAALSKLLALASPLMDHKFFLVLLGFSTIRQNCPVQCTPARILLHFLLHQQANSEIP